MANYLSIADNGKYAYATSLVLIFGSISAYAGAELIIPRLNKYHYLRPYILTHGWYLRLMYAFTCLCISTVVCLFYIQDSGVAHTFFVLMLSPFFMELSGIFTCWFMVQSNYIFSAIARLLGFAIRLGIIYFLSKQTIQSVDFYYFAYAQLLELIIMSTCIYVFYFNYSKRLPWTKFNYRIFKILCNNGLLIGLSLSVSFIFLKIDRYLIKQYLSFEEIAMYAMAIQLNEACLLLAQAILMVVVNRFIFSDKYAFKHCVKNVLGIIFIVSIAAIMSVYILAEPIIINIIDARYIHSAAILKKAIFLLPLYSLNYVLYSYFLYHKKYIFTLVVWGMGVCILFCVHFLNALTMYINISYGIIYAYVCAYVCMCAMYMLGIKRVVK